MKEKRATTRLSHSAVRRPLRTGANPAPSEAFLLPSSAVIPVKTGIPRHSALLSPKAAVPATAFPAAGSSGNPAAPRAPSLIGRHSRGGGNLVAQWSPLRTLVVTLFVLTVLGTAGPATAQMGPEIPLQFKIIGKFYAPGQEKETGVHAFEVNILKKTRILDVVSSHTLEGSMLGSSVLNQMYPPIMTFMGPESLLAPLINPDNEGKTYVLTGQLYVKRRLFQVQEVQVVGEEEQAKPETRAPETPAPGANAPESP